jgi:serine/threonine-protein kinase PknG
MPSTRTSVTSSTSRLGMLPMGSARSGASVTRPTNRLGTGAASRLGAGLTQVPAVPMVDPRQALMDPPMVAEEKRYCSVCQSEVGRTRGAKQGRTKGFCPKCGAAFDFDPKLQPGMLLGGQYEVVGCLAHGGMGWIYLARDRNVNDRWVVLKGLLNTGDPDATRAAIAEKQFLAEVEHPLIVEIYNFVAAPDGASYIVMEYVGGRSLNAMLKDRMKAAGRFSPIPVDQAIAYLVEILPAFSYLHSLGLLYCDFKPANVIQVGDSLKLIDLGGVRRSDDNESAIYGTVGFQAPEVAGEGCSVASDVFTVARTLAVLVFEFRGSQSHYEFTLPDSGDVPLLAEHDSLYRWLLKGTAAKPEDRFQSAEEMRLQLLGVLREVTASVDSGTVTRSTPSELFDSPTVAEDRLNWDDLPRPLPDRDDPMTSWMSGITTDEPLARLEALAAAPEETSGVLAERSLASLRLGRFDDADAASSRMLQLNPWEWRAVWLHGLSMLGKGDVPAAVAAFNTVYGQLPGELAPKLALARACELAGEAQVAGRMYRACARTDAAYVAPAQFGLARLAVAAGDRADALAALDAVPQTSRAFGEARRKRAQLLASAIDPQRVIEDLGLAAAELERADLQAAEVATLRAQIFESALQFVTRTGDRRGVQIDGVEAAETSLRAELERAYRTLARFSADQAERVRLVDQANAVRPRSLV